MSKTTVLNSGVNERNSEKANKLASMGAKAAAVTGAGIAGATIASKIIDINGAFDDDIEEVVEVPTETTSVEQTVTPSDNQGATNQPSSALSQTVSNATTNASQTTDNIEPQPITGNANATEIPTNPTAATATDNPANQTTSNTTTSNTADPNSNQATTNTSSASAAEEPVNPDEVAEAIIAENQIDPNDIDMEDIINFDEIGTVYTVSGESYTAASFHDNDGNQFAMVDIDGDDVFDLVIDEEGNTIMEVNGNLTVDDAELAIEDDGEYLAHDNTTDEFGTDTIVEDLLS